MGRFLLPLYPLEALLSEISCEFKKISEIIGKMEKKCNCHKDTFPKFVHNHILSLGHSGRLILLSGDEETFVALNPNWSQ